MPEWAGKKKKKKRTVILIIIGMGGRSWKFH